MRQIKAIPRVAAVLATALALWCQGVAAQVTHGAPTRITTSFPSGAGPDVVARMVAEKLQARWGQPVIVDSKPGGAGVVAVNAMKRLAPNGTELVVTDVGTLSINPLIFKNLAYDPEKELTPVALLYKTAFFIAVGADSPYKSAWDLIAAAKAKPGGLTYGSNAVGGPIHLASAQLEDAIGATMVHVPFKETSQLYAAVSTGEVSWAYGSIATAGPLLRGGKLRFLAVADKVRSTALPDVPTLAEAGGPANIDAQTWVALLAPAGTPPAVVADINKAVGEALATPDVKERMATFGFLPSALSAQQVADLMRADRMRYGEIVRRVKVSVD